jgi:hypothetical protein
VWVSGAEITDRGDVIERGQVQRETVGSDHQVGCRDLLKKFLDRLFGIGNHSVKYLDTHEGYSAMDNDEVVWERIQQPRYDPLPLISG